MLRSTIVNVRKHTNSLFVTASFCVLLLSMISCEKSVDIDIQTNDRRLVASGDFTNDTSVQSIRLYRSGSVTTGRPQAAVSGAKVLITDGIDTFAYLENPGSPGLYQTPTTCFGIGGHTYTLHISSVDIDGDGSDEEYTAQATMPVPVSFDSLVSFYGMNGDNIPGTVDNRGYYTTFYGGPDYLYHYVVVNNSDTLFTISDRLGTGQITTWESVYQAKKQNVPGLTANGLREFWIEPPHHVVETGDTICMVGLNFNKDQYEFLKAFDNNTTGGSLVQNNLYDPLRIPANLPTNIQPSDKAAGYFFIYSVSRITGVFEASQ
jgi:hypothetical protein